MPSLPTLRRLILITCFATLAACANSVNQECTRELQCNDGPGNQTVTQCESAWNNCIDALNKGAAPCQQLASALETYAACAQGLTCSNRSSEALQTQGTCDLQTNTLKNVEDNANAAGCALCQGVAGLTVVQGSSGTTP